MNGVKGTSPLAGGKVQWTFPGAEPTVLIFKL